MPCTVPASPLGDMWMRLQKWNIGSQLQWSHDVQCKEFHLRSKMGLRVREAERAMEQHIIVYKHVTAAYREAQWTRLSVGQSVLWKGIGGSIKREMVQVGSLTVCQSIPAETKSVRPSNRDTKMLLCCLDRRFNLAVQSPLRRYFILLQTWYTEAGNDDIGRCLTISPTRIWLVNRWRLCKWG